MRQFAAAWRVALPAIGAAVREATHIERPKQRDEFVDVQFPARHDRRAAE